MAATLYLTDQELIAGHLPGDVETQSTSDERALWIEAASAEADGYLRRAGYTLPLSSVGADLRAAVGAIAAFRLASKLGLVPQPAAQSDLYLNYKTALEWLRGVASGSVTPDVTDDDASGEPSGGPLVNTNPRRDW